VEDWPLAYPGPGAWGVGPATVFAAELPTDVVDATLLAGKSMFETGVADGFRPGSFTIPNEKEEANLDFSNCYDKNGQYIFNVFEDELEEVPDYLYDYMDVHAPLSQEKEETVPPKAEDVLPTLGLTKLFSQLENMISEPADSSETISTPSKTSSLACRSPELARTLEAVEHAYRRIGVYCGV